MFYRVPTIFLLFFELAVGPGPTILWYFVELDVGPGHPSFSQGSKKKKKINGKYESLLVLTLLQAVTWFSATRAGCCWLISYIEQKQFLACGPEFSVEFSAPPEFSGSVTEKNLSTGWARTFDLQIRKQIFYQCATAPLCTISYDIHCVPSWDFPAVFVVTGRQIFRPYLVVTCRDFPAVSAVTGS